jgi:formate transporter
LPVTIGNIVGGALLVGLVYWFVYRRHAEAEAEAS